MIYGGHSLVQLRYKSCPGIVCENLPDSKDYLSLADAFNS